MKMEKTSEKEEKTTVADRLPELNEEDANNAVSHQQLSWAHGFMKNYNDGVTHFMKDVGVQLQKVTEDTVRCVAVVDHPYCLSSLAMVVLAFERAGVELQVDPYTVVIPYEPREEEDTEEAAGVEVA